MKNASVDRLIQKAVWKQRIGYGLLAVFILSLLILLAFINTYTMTDEVVRGKVVGTFVQSGGRRYRPRESAVQASIQMPDGATVVTLIPIRMKPEVGDDFSFQVHAHVYLPWQKWVPIRKVSQP